MKLLTTSRSILLLLGLLLVFSCEKRPTDPGRFNPFDPENPDILGDPYNLSAEIANGGIRLTWTQLFNPQPEGYNLYRSVNDSVFIKSQELDRTGSYTDTNIVNGRRYEYYIIAKVAAGEASSSNVVSVSLDSDPILFIESESSTHTPCRHINLTIIAFGAEKMQLSNTDDISGSPILDYENETAWELPDGRGDKVVYLQVTYENDRKSPVVSDTIQPSPLDPVVVIEDAQSIDGLKYISSNEITLSLPGLDAFEMILSSTMDSAGSQWQSYSETSEFTLSDGDGWRYVFAWFRHDFFTVGPAIDSAIVDTHCEIDSFFWTSTGNDTLAPYDTVIFTLIAIEESFGPESGGTAEVQIEGIENPIPLTDQGDGTYSARYIITGHTQRFTDASITATLTDRLGNIADPDTSLPFNGGGYLVGATREFPIAEDVSVWMVWIPKGQFEMGAYSGEADASVDESPQHTVTFARGFWIGAFEVTQQQWVAITGENPSSFDGDDRPVENISWQDAVDFKNELNYREGTGFWRLPSEAEWEYACRSGTETRFHWGDDPDYTELSQYAWYSAISNFETHDVGGLYSNLYDIYDMHGNVEEWCYDRYHYDYTGAPEDGSAWFDWQMSSFVTRGGSWFNSGSDLRSASRSYAEPDNRSSSTGFRLARTEPE
ncbi:SUMF1/EgtB/PvdO family nonheme iron enzyme [Calditrichota bacterium]